MGLHSYTTKNYFAVNSHNVVKDYLLDHTINDNNTSSTTDFHIHESKLYVFVKKVLLLVNG